MIKERLLSVEEICQYLGLSRNRVCEIVGNTNIGNIDTLLAQGAAGLPPWTSLEV